ncbi:MAG: hypothetical protein M0T77_13675 [Actinomycetota bacterium]|nr:hypothetical protein [Actinomycetota bacterium]
MQSTVDYGITVWLTSLLIYTGFLKLTDLPESRRAVRRYRLTAAKYASLVGSALPAVEIAVAALLLDSGTRRFGGWATLSLGLAFVYATVHALRARIDVSCGCVGKASGPVNVMSVVRAVVISACGGFLAVSGEQPRLSVIPMCLVAGVPCIPAVVGMLSRRRGPSRAGSHKPVVIMRHVGDSAHQRVAGR